MSLVAAIWLASQLLHKHTQVNNFFIIEFHRQLRPQQKVKTALNNFTIKFYCKVTYLVDHSLLQIITL